jgi:hypothetical protein
LKNPKGLREKSRKATHLLGFKLIDETGGYTGLNLCQNQQRIAKHADEPEEEEQGKIIQSCCNRAPINTKSKQADIKSP